MNVDWHVYLSPTHVHVIIIFQVSIVSRTTFAMPCLWCDMEWFYIHINITHVMSITTSTSPYYSPMMFVYVLFTSSVYILRFCTWTILFLFLLPSQGEPICSKILSLVTTLNLYTCVLLFNFLVTSDSIVFPIFYLYRRVRCHLSFRETNIFVEFSRNIVCVVTQFFL